MRLLDFLETFIEGYLFGDLKTMEATSPKTKHGHLGYPMFMSCAAGIEMLGILISTDKFERAPAKNFLRYWQRYLYPNGVERDVGEAVYKSARHGIAHNFAAKHPIDVYKPPLGQSSPGHLVNVDGAGAAVDVLKLFADLKQSYERHVRPVATGLRSGTAGETSATMQLRLQELIDDNAKEMAPYLASLAALPRVPASPSPGADVAKDSVASPTGGLPPIPSPNYTSKGSK